MNDFVFEVRNGKPFINGTEITANRITIKVFSIYSIFLLFLSFFLGIVIGGTYLPIILSFLG